MISAVLDAGLVSNPMPPAVRDDWSVLPGDPGGRAAGSGGAPAHSRLTARPPSDAMSTTDQGTEGRGMTTTTYYAVTAYGQLAAAQRALDVHITSSATGLCLACGTCGPCRERRYAVVIFSRTLRLPHRLPDATRPELVGPRSTGTNWFGAASR